MVAQSGNGGVGGAAHAGVATIPATTAVKHARKARRRPPCLPPMISVVRILTGKPTRTCIGPKTPADSTRKRIIKA